MAMDADMLNQARNVAAQHSEGIHIEHKTWMDLANPDEKAKVIKACMALRNMDGGWLAIGIENGTGKAAKNPPIDIRAAYDADAINKLIVEFSSDPFGVDVCYPDIDGAEVAVLRIPGGVQSPAITKKAIPAAKPLDADSIYCRSTRSGQVSTVKANHRDLQELMDGCMRNREANLGAFVRRHWDGLVSEVNKLQEEPATVLNEFVGRCLAQFEQSLKDQQLISIPRPGLISVGVAWDKELPEKEATASQFASLVMAHPHLGGWSPWLDPRDFNMHPNCKRAVRNGAWDGLIAITQESEQGTIYYQLDYSVWDFRVGLFHAGIYVDDYPDLGLQQMAMRGETWNKGEVPPWYRRLLDRRNITRDVANRLFTAQSLVAGLFNGQRAELPENLNFVFRFDGLKGRFLADYQGGGMLRPTSQAMDESVSSSVQLKMNSDKAVIAERTRAILRPLFAAFGGEDLSQQKVDTWLSGFWEGR